MSKLPFVPIFSAAHVSKWDVLPEDTLTGRATQPKIGPTRPSVDDIDQSNDADLDACAPSESSKSNGGIFSTCEGKVTVRTAAPVAVVTNRVSLRPIESCGTYIFILSVLGNHPMETSFKCYRAQN